MTALDARLMGGAPPTEGEITKLDVVAENVFAVWQEHRDAEYLDEWGEVSPTKGAFQIVFSDMGTPNTSEAWNAYRELRDQLVARGIPVEQVRFIHEATNDKQKAELFQQCRDGRVQVLVGSTEKMGVGTNVQARAIALHHVDAPWRPADVTQREGRVIRQGNQNGKVRIFRYATEGSFDSYMWGTLARKAAFIEQVLTGRLDVREVDNSTEMALQFAEMQAVTAGDMRILEVANLRADTLKLGRQQRAHQRKIGSVEARRLLLEQACRVTEHDLKVMQELAPKVVETRGDRFEGTVKPVDWTEAPPQRERKEFGQALRTAAVRARSSWNSWEFGPYNASYPRPMKISVTLAGLDWDAQLRWNPVSKVDPLVEFHAGSTHQAMVVSMRWSRLVEGELSALSQPFETRARELPELIEEHEAQAAQAKEEIEQLRTLELEPWAKVAELEEKRERLATLVKELEQEAATADAPPRQIDPEPGPIDNSCVPM